MTGPVAAAGRWGSERLLAMERWFVGAPRARYGASVARIVFGTVVVLFVAANFARRDYLWGPASGWVDPLRPTTAWSFPFTFYSSADPEWLFTLKLLVLGLAGLALLVGWHARIAGIITWYLYVSLVTTNPVATDQTDNAMRIILLFLLFTNLSAEWSLDARRRRRRAAAGRPARRLVPDWFANILHNGGIVAIALQIFVIYVEAGLSKVQGSQWQDGTAVYYPLQLDSLAPWPWLSDLVTANAVLVNLVTYFAVFIQVFFPLLLLNRVTRVIALLGIVGMHVGIGVLMGLPLFSLSMMAADGIFIRDRTYARVAGFAREQWAARRHAARATETEGA